MSTYFEGAGDDEYVPRTEFSDEFEYFARTVLLETELNKVPLKREREKNEKRRSELIASLVTSTISTPPGLALSRMDLEIYCV